MAFLSQSLACTFYLISKTWPKVDVMFQSHTADFPYIMVYDYVQYHKPMLINDLESEQLLWDRTVTYQALKDIGVPVPKYFPLYMHPNHVDRIEKESYGKIFAENGETINYEDYIQNSSTTPSLFR